MSETRRGVSKRISQYTHFIVYVERYKLLQTRAAPGGDAGRGDEAATRGPNGVHGCDLRPSARIAGGDVRYRTGVRSPTPHKVLRARTSDEFKETIAI